MNVPGGLGPISQRNMFVYILKAQNIG